MSTFGKVASLGGVTDQNKIDQARAKAVLGTDEWDNQIADYTAQFLPPDTKVEYSKHPNKIAAVSQAFDPDDPRKNLGLDIKDTFQKLLTRPELAGVDPQQLLPVVAQAYTEGYAPDVHSYTRKAESSLFGFGGKQVVRAPGYEEWLAGKQQEEAAQEASDDAEYNIGKKIATWAGLGAGIQLGTIVGKKAFAKAAGRAVMAIPHPVAKIAGAALLAIPEFAAFEKVAEWIGESEWGRANQEEGKIDRVDVLEALAGIAVGYGVHKTAQGVMGARAKTLATRQAAKDAEAARIAGLPEPTVLGAEDRALVPVAPGMRNEVEVERIAQKTLPTGEVKLLGQESTAGVGGFGTAGVKGTEEEIAQATVQYKKHFETLVGLGVEYDAAKAAMELEPTAVNLVRFKTAQGALKKHTDGNFVPALQRIRATQAEDAGALNETWLTQKGKVAEGDFVLDSEFVAADEAAFKSTSPLVSEEAMAAAKVGEGNAPIIRQPKDRKGLFVSKNQPVLDAESFGTQAAEVAELRAKQLAEPNGIKAAELGKVADDKAKLLVKKGEEKLASFDETAVVELQQRVKAGQNPAEAMQSTENAMVARKGLVKDRGKQLAAVDAVVKKQQEVLKTRAAAATAVLKKLEAQQLKTSEQLIAESQSRSLAETELISSKSVGAENLVAQEPLVAPKEVDFAALYGRGATAPKSKLPDFTADNLPPVSKFQRGEMTAQEYFAQPAELLKAEYDQFNRKGLGEQLSKQRRLIRERFDNELMTVRQTKAEELLESGERDFVNSPAESVAAKIGEVLNSADRTGGSKGKAALIASILSPAAVALGIMFEPLSPNEADAGVLDNFMKQAFNVADDVVVSTLKKDMVESMPVHKVGSGKLAPKAETIQVQAGVTDETGKYVGSTEAVKGVQRTPQAIRAFQNVVSPHRAADMFYNRIGNPSVVLAHKVQGMLADIANGFGFLDDVYKGVPGMDAVGRQAAFREVRQVMKPIAEKYNQVWLPASIREARVAQLKDAIKRTEGKIAKTSDEAKVETFKMLNQKRIDALKVEEEKLAGLLEGKKAFGEEYQTAIKHLAGKHASTRIALAAEDTAEFAKFPWLKDMLSESEQGAVAQVKGMMREYGERMKAVGGKPIEGDYVHHALHPDIDPASLKKITDEVIGDNPFGLAFTKFHHRAQSSLQIMPEMSFVMEKYLPDVNRKIMTRDFWQPGVKTGWDYHSRNAPEVVGSKALQQYWRNFRDALEPREVDWADNAAKYYSSFEALRLLAFMPSTAAKHMVKITADFVQRPLSVNIAAMPRSMRAAFKITLKEVLPQKIGRKITLNEEEAFLEAMTRQQHVMESISDMGLGDLPTQASGLLTKQLDKLNKTGGAMIRMVEMFDRSHNVLSGLEMASRTGMTPHQAKFAIMSSILNNNFLGGVQNPAWLNNPKIRALLMFQGTPFKIAERRAQTLLMAGKNIKGGAEELVRQLKNLRSDMVDAEHEFKKELIWEALHQEKDLYGSSLTNQAMKEIIGVGAIVVAGKEALNMDFWDYTLHLPFMKGGKSDPTLALNPLISSGYRTSARREEDDEDLWVADFFKDYFRNQGPLPNIFTKVARLSKGDIPEIYRSSQFPQFSYMFAIPGVER